MVNPSPVTQISIYKQIVFDKIDENDTSTIYPFGYPFHVMHISIQSILIR